MDQIHTRSSRRQYYNFSTVLNNKHESAEITFSFPVGSSLAKSVFLPAENSVIGVGVVLAPGSTSFLGPPLAAASLVAC